MLVIIPVFNEEQTLGEVVDAVRRVVPSADVLVVDDGSTDRSAAILARVQARDRRVHVLTHPENQGYGRALIDGFGHAVARGYQAVVTIDCDAQHEPRHIPRFLEALRDADIASGSRYLDPTMGGDPAPPDRLAINREITAHLRRVTGYALTDAWCGFKAYRGDLLRRLVLDEPGYAMPLQVWVQAARLGARVSEVPVARIYKNPARRFWGGLDDPATRRRYYRQVLERELVRGRREAVGARRRAAPRPGRPA